MLALYIILAVLAFLALLMSFRIYVNCKYKDDLFVTIRFLFLKFQIVPSKKKVKTSDFSIKKFRRKRLKEEKAYQKKLKKKNKKKEKSESQKAKEKPKLSETVKKWYGILKDIGLPTLKKFFAKLYLSVDKCIIGIHNEDPSKTAINYGYFSQCFAYMMEMISENKKAKYGEIGMYADFISDKSSADVDVTVGITTFQALGVLIFALIRYLKHPDKTKKQTRTDKKSVKEE